MRQPSLAAFVLGAGLGTRLRPLTSLLPKPLVPLRNRPLIAHVFDRLIGAGVVRFVVNTHYLPRAYEEAFPDSVYRGCPIHFRHEPVLLDTAGGIRNSAHLLRESFLLCNGDILADLDLESLIAVHRESGNLATLVLRTRGPNRNVRFDAAAGRVLDLRGVLDPAQPGTHQYTGIAAIDPALVERIPPGVPVSLVSVWTEAIQAGLPIGGVVMNQGNWMDLGTVGEYLEAHHRPPAAGPLLDPACRVESGVRLEGSVTIGPGVVVESGARLRDVVVWSCGGPLRIGSDARLIGCVAFGCGVVRGANVGPVIAGEPDMASNG